MPEFDGQIVKTLHWDRQQLTKAWKRGDVAAISACVDHIVFVLNVGVERGVMIKSDGTIKRYKTESKAWGIIDEIKGHAIHQI